MSAKRLASRFALVVAGLLLCGVIAGVAAQSSRADTTLFFDNMENGVNGWTVSTSVVGTPTMCVSEWHQDTVDPAVNPSETHYWTNSPYRAAGSGNCLNHLTSPSIPTPATATALTLTFWEHHFTEGGTICNPPENSPPCDFGIVEIGNGGVFKALPDPDFPTRFEGGTALDPYVEVEFPIPATYYTAGLPIQVRFTFSSDALLAEPFLGWFIDDVMVTAATPTSVGVSSFTGKATGRKAVTLSWKTGSEAGVLGFNVWRYGGAKSVKVNRTLIAARAAGGAAGAAYRLVDRTARPGVRYTYRLQIVNSSGKRTWAAPTTVRAGR